MPIKFGTDGWRAVIAEDYTFENVRLCAQGTAAFLKAHGLDSRGVVIGYDTRFGSEDFAAAVAEVTAANGIPTYVCDRAAPTPVIAYNLVAREGGGGVVITASHNPARWNGFKYKPSYGGSASPEIVAELEEYIEDAERSGDVQRMPLAQAKAEGLVEYFDPEPTYLGHIATLVDLNAIRNAGLDVVVDVMHGAGAGYFPKLLGGGSTRIIEMRAERNPSFPGMAQPEPLAHNLQGLMEEVQDRTADVGLATDGDADRLGVVDDTGRFITTLQTFALLCYHQLEVLKNSGPLVRSITMTSMIDRLGEIYDVPVFDTPVGFKYLGPVMMEEDALIAGEESGGYAFRGNIPERDGILSGLMLLDLIVKTEKGVSDLLEELTEKVGPHFYDRLDLKFEESQRKAILSRIQKAAPSSFAGRKVESVDTRDGFRFVLEGGYWTLIRFSGTEPLLRVYAEAESPADVQTMLDEARNIAGV
ncbi:MAG: phosphoglucomutase/phosphomannomutase family protein [Chloroflexi bacterium]|nr:phosphoglucomutase/phosphomannomutase family protein [Chloroflexota bacterium]MCI0868552.1 phosphoglucomutase/phosphomannomutase family protein [Chloroflexota bacterium]